MHGWFTLSNILHRQNEKSIHTLLKLRTIRADKLVIDSFATALDYRNFPHPGGPHSNTPRTATMPTGLDQSGLLIGCTTTGT